MQEHQSGTAAGSAPAGAQLEFRRARDADRDELAEYMERVRAHYAGARHPALYKAIAADSVGARPRIVTSIVVWDGRIAGFAAAILADRARYWATLPIRHPLAAAAIARHRLRKLTTRISYRRSNRANYASDAVLVPEVPLPPEVSQRLSARPPATGSPRPGERGPRIAQVLFVSTDPDLRGQGASVRMYRTLFEELRAEGAERCDCSFSLRDPAAIRMHCNFPFTIYRLPGGYWGSLRLADL